MPRGRTVTSSRSLSSFRPLLPSKITRLMIGFSTTVTIMSPFWKSIFTSENRSVRNNAFSARSIFAESTGSPGDTGR